MASSFFLISNSSSKSRLPATRSAAFMNPSKIVNSSLPFSDDCKVFFKGLKKKTSPACALSAFLPFGSVLLIKVPFSQFTKKNMGHGYVVFKEARIAQKLVESVGSLDIEGKVVLLSGYDFRQKKSYKEKCNSGKVSRASLGHEVQNKLCNGNPQIAQPIRQAGINPQDKYVSMMRTKTSSRESFGKGVEPSRLTKAPEEAERNSMSLLWLKPTSSSYHNPLSGSEQQLLLYNIRFNICPASSRIPQISHLVSHSDRRLDQWHLKTTPTGQQPLTNENRTDLSATS